MLLCHGEKDEMLTLDRAGKSVEQLQAAGANLEHRFYAGMGELWLFLLVCFAGPASEGERGNGHTRALAAGRPAAVIGVVRHCWPTAGHTTRADELEAVTRFLFERLGNAN